MLVGVGSAKLSSTFSQGQSHSLGGTLPAGRACCEGPGALNGTSWKLVLTLLPPSPLPIPALKGEFPGCDLSHKRGSLPAYTPTNEDQGWAGPLAPCSDWSGNSSHAAPGQSFPPVEFLVLFGPGLVHRAPPG